MTMKRVAVFLFAAQPLGGSCTDSVANPIRRVVALLQKMQTQVVEQGKKEEDLYEKFQCYCKTGNSDLSASISAAEAKITQDTSSLDEAEAQSEQLKKDLAEHKASRADAKDASAKATALRKKEAATFAKEDSDHTTNIDALGRAITAIEKGASGSFLQTTAAARLRQLTIDMDMSSVDRDALSAFLSHSQGYAPQSGEITGILKQMKDTMEKDHGEILATEKQAIADYDALMAAKAKEIAANTKSIEQKTERLGQTSVDIVNLEEDLDDTTKSLRADKQFLANLGSSCDTKKAEWEARSKIRSDELLALADTIKLLNDDDSLELFKKTLPSPSLIQMRTSGAAVRKQAMQILKRASGKKDPRMELVMLALAGKGKSFDKVLKMIDDMVALLGREQTDDDDKKAYCESKLDKTDDEKKRLEQSLEDLEKSMETDKESIANLAAEIKALIAGVKALDKSVQEATETRKDENSEYKATMAANKAAKELIALAKNRMMKFYNPDLYVAPKKQELSAEQRIAVNMGSEAAPTTTPSGVAGTGITYFVQVSAHSHSAGDEAPPPPPETWGAYQKKGQEQNGVTAMMDLLVADLDKEISEMGVDEKNAQAEYETFMADSQAKRSQDSKAIADKEGTKAELEARLQKSGAEHGATTKEAYATATTIKDLHLECDWLLSAFGARKEARAGEAESLKSAKAVLSGADFALIEQSTRSKHLRGLKVAGPKGAGIPEDSMSYACAECNKHAKYLDTKDDCSCHATDIMRTFANDATKELTTDSKYGTETANTGAKELKSGWTWHCRPVSDTGVWKQCPAEQ